MADVKRLVFSILTFLEDQKKTGGLDDEQVESLEGNQLTCWPADHHESILIENNRLQKIVETV